ncbi:MAG: lipopolysaccharide core biosynthesis protein [Zetaproteobacteria bacterium CG12_big_fil_rev_8_21_14_0_65_54_13]|nr:MAG: lipopolysaccharide core biosynthesis protein [Zetaproteobacteria bacterium CG12_big_fil_rev_8_21_14_0_65_54_13]PJA28218.1 MAG: lipopolysaccharide core biosynthesis protein [Zetaproteobacteria bacterium CG_4_9_14_3_um_filter_54_145]
MSRQVVNKPLNLLYIVRRFGPVGGMERYVWELAREMAEMGHKVSVLCEAIHADLPPSGVTCIELGSLRPKPRWLAHLRFSHRVSQWVAAHPESTRIIHSHERTAVHHATTFHGPPFASVRDKPLWKRCSPRIYANLWLEHREVCGRQVEAVIPNSSMIGSALNHYYPCIGSRMTAPIAPGVGKIPVRAAHTPDMDGGIIGFVGKEWQRKGLDLAVAIVKKLREKRPNLQFVVAGPKPADIEHLFTGWNDGYQLLGETDSTPLYAGFDLLLHPARQEPYGMVIAEARAAAVPVLVSDACGIAPELEAEAVLPMSAGIDSWTAACMTLLKSQREPEIRSWRAVAEEQVRCYRQLTPATD